ncbi:putative C6 transcription factor [Aspergillus clavatus NRRL 1]|uniref:C6 transcription factor, putative n=1 Tax=Aspergillus clavatus (strain ATCC 1007 / CBS 513.65 / DSM 816 / NCTC 3887 / NRRL 1 / QM 1276 / 107) TaxID=344612 RepID=A1CKW4_ASPCL|nr:C6 transcription factor, putative [Aspergillus clavatus NRRL 1]EAW09788.1 C6 transcription factor, putative [Aspergillus clavatus NRRL 1]
MEHCSPVSLVAKQNYAATMGDHASSPGSNREGSRLRVTLEPPSALPGYLGSTSYSAVLTEHRSDIPYELDNSSAAAASTRSVDSDRLQLGIEMLKLLYDLPICDIMIRKYHVRTVVTIVPIIIIEAILQSFRRVFETFEADDFETQFQDLVHQIFQNTSRPLTVHGSMTVEQYFSSFTGRNSRWEALGNIFAITGIALMSTPDSDPDLSQAAPDSEAKERLRAQIVEASGICLGFCDQASSANELLGFFQYNDVMLRTQQYGDSSYQAWRRLGDLSATIYAAGLHQENVQADDCPYFLRQWRRLCFASAFYADKSLATFVGRPPLINYRYCTLTPPLDVSHEILIAGGSTLTQAIAELDKAGWHVYGSTHAVTLVRLRFLLAIFREQALELALGFNDQDDLVQKSNQLVGKTRTTWDTAPSYLRYDIRTEGDDGDIYCSYFALLHTYLDYLYTIFLIQRTLVKRTNTGHEALFDTSREVLSIIVRINTERNSQMDMSRHYSWVVLYYGLPSASVLTLELLRQSQEVGPHSIVLPRAELIRNLSVFVSCLSWVARPGQGNYQTCKEVEKKLSHILDQILDPQPVQAEVFNDVTSGLFNYMDGYNPNTWDFNFEYLPSRDGFPV